MVFRFFFYLFIFPLFLSTESLGRWGTLTDAPAAIEFFHRDIEIDRDGKQVETVEYIIKILNEEGRHNEGIQRLIYNETNEKLEILEAKTVFDLDEEKIHLLSQGNTFANLKINVQNVEKNMTEKQAVLSENTSFDNISQIILSYPNVKINSWIYLKTKRTVLEPPLPGYFSTDLYYQGVWNRSRVTVRSALPFKIHVHDVDQNLSIQESYDNKIQILTVAQKKPIVRFLIDEPVSSIPDETKMTFINISTHADFKTLGNSLAKQYNEVLDQALPSEFNFIVEEARKQKTEVDQINTVTSSLIERIHYLTDLRTIKGRIIPQSFKDIALTFRGDCKDSSSLTAKILRALGFKAYVCLIYRGEPYQTPKLMLPSLGLFNHAIVKAIAPSGKIYWIDPTNLVSMAGYIFSDISDRGVLVLDEVSSYEQTPAIDPEQAQVIREETITIKKQDSSIHRVGTLTFKGQEAQRYTTFNLLSSKETIEHVLLENLGTNNDVQNYHFERDEIKSRNVKTATIKYNFDQYDDSPFSNEGESFSLSSLWIRPFLKTSVKQEGISFLNYPRTFKQIRFLQHCDAENLQALECDLKTPWFEAHRRINKESKGIKIIEDITLLKSFITSEEIRSEEFIKAKKEIQKYFGNTLLIFSGKDLKEKGRL